MKRICLILLVLISGLSQAQVGVGTATPSNAAMLEVDGGNATSGYRGFMPPRIPLFSDLATIAPLMADQGLQVFVQETGCLMLWSGTTWEIVYCTGGVSDIWINEFHYQDIGNPDSEFIELAGLAGVDLTDYYVALYNGTNGESYGAIVEFFGVIDDEGTGYGAVSQTVPDMQVGIDGMALFGPNNRLIQFLSYEGVFTATAGPAKGQLSTDVGVQELTNTPVGQSLQLTGTGNNYSNFTWQSPAADSPGTINAGQTIN